MDEFVGFNYLLLDASGGPAQEAKVLERGEQRERVDVIARQFRDFLKKPAPPGSGSSSGVDDDGEDGPRGIMLTHDFKLRGRATRAAGWLSFHVDRGDGRVEALEAVALVYFARDGGHDVDEQVHGVLWRLAPGAVVRSLPQLPPAPLAVSVLLVSAVPSVVREMLAKAAAGFFSREF